MRFNDFLSFIRLFLLFFISLLLLMLPLCAYDMYVHAGLWWMEPWLLYSQQTEHWLLEWKLLRGLRAELDYMGFFPGPLILLRGQ